MVSTTMGSGTAWRSAPDGESRQAWSANGGATIGQYSEPNWELGRNESGLPVAERKSSHTCSAEPGSLGCNSASGACEFGSGLVYSGWDGIGLHASSRDQRIGATQRVPSTGLPDAQLFGGRFVGGLV